MSPTLDHMRASLTSAHDMEGVSMAYSISLPGIPLGTRKGAVSGWDPKYGSDPRKVVGCARRESSGGSEECVLHVESPTVSMAASTGRADGWRRACSAANVS